MINLLDHFFFVAGLNAKCVLAPRGFRIFHADRVPAFAAAVRVVDRVHDLAANARAETLVAHAAGFAQNGSSDVRALPTMPIVAPRFLGEPNAIRRTAT